MQYILTISLELPHGRGLKLDGASWHTKLQTTKIPFVKDSSYLGFGCQFLLNYYNIDCHSCKGGKRNLEWEHWN